MAQFLACLQKNKKTDLWVSKSLKYFGLFRILLFTKTALRRNPALILLPEKCSLHDISDHLKRFKYTNVLIATGFVVSKY